jgi:hypothetical protein
MDMSKGFSLSTIAQTAQQMIKRGIPFRIGLVPMITDSDNDNSELVRWETVLSATAERHDLKASRSLVCWHI